MQSTFKTLNPQKLIPVPPKVYLRLVRSLPLLLLQCIAGKRKSKSKGHVGIGPRLASGTATVVPPAPHSTVDYRKFDNINVSSDDEEEVKKQSSAPDSLYQKIDQGCRCEMCQQFTEETPQLPSPDYGRRPSEDNESLGSEEEEEEEDYVVQLPPQKGSKALAPKPTQQPPQAIKRGFFGSKPTTSASIKPTGMGFTDPSAKSGGRITGDLCYPVCQVFNLSFSTLSSWVQNLLSSEIGQMHACLQF